MKRRDFLAGTAVVAVASVLPRSAVARVAVADEIASLLRKVGSGGSLATAPNWCDSERYTYLLCVDDWVLTMHRCQYPWELVAFVEDAVDPQGRLSSENTWGVSQDPLSLLTAADQAAFDRVVVADMRSRFKLATPPRS